MGVGGTEEALSGGANGGESGLDAAEQLDSALRPVIGGVH